MALHHSLDGGDDLHIWSVVVSALNLFVDVDSRQGDDPSGLGRG